MWLHGGSYIYGFGDDLMHGPDYIVRKDVVLVTLNYRLGALGKWRLAHLPRFLTYFFRFPRAADASGGKRGVIARKKKIEILHFFAAKLVSYREKRPTARSRRSVHTWTFQAHARDKLTQ